MRLNLYLRLHVFQGTMDVRGIAFTSKVFGNSLFNAHKADIKSTSKACQPNRTHCLGTLYSAICDLLKSRPMEPY